MWWNFLFSLLRIGLLISLLIPLIFLTDEGQQKFGLTSFQATPLVIFTPRHTATFSSQERIELFRQLKKTYGLGDLRVVARQSYDVNEESFLNNNPSGLVVVLTDHSLYGPQGDDFLRRVEKTKVHQENRLIFMPRSRLSQAHESPFLLLRNAFLTPQVYSGEETTLSLFVVGFSSPSQGSWQATLTWQSEKKPPVTKILDISPNAQGHIFARYEFKDVFTTPGFQTLTVQLDSPVTPPEQNKLTWPFVVGAAQTPVFLWTNPSENPQQSHHERLVGLWLRGQNRFVSSPALTSSVVAVVPQVGALPFALHQWVQKQQGRLLLFSSDCSITKENILAKKEVSCILEKDLGVDFFLEPPVGVPPGFFLWQKQRNDREERLRQAALFLQGF